MKLSKEEAVKAVQGIEDNEVYVYSQKEYAELLDNFKKTTIESELKSRIAKVYDDVDADFMAVTGLKKPDDVKTYKYWPEVAKTLKEQAEQAKTEVEKLKLSANPDLSKEIEALRKASIEKDAEWKGKYESLQKELTVRDIKGELAVAVSKFKLTKLPEPVVNTFIESAKNKLSQSAKMVDGQLLFLDAEGSPRINKETFKPYTAEELMAVELDPILDKGKPNEGGGTKPPKLQKDKDGKLDISMIVPQSVKNRNELTKFLIESGLPFGTPEHNAAYDKYSENLPIA